MQNTENNFRWWEFYGIRYAIGTVMGAIIVYALFENNDLLRKLLIKPQDGNFTSIQLIVYSVYGLTYCYIASAPILVFHATRFILLESKVLSYMTRHMIRILLWVLLWAGFILASFVINYSLPAPHWSTQLLSILIILELLVPFLLFILYQGLLINSTVKKCPDVLIRYMTLAKKRELSGQGFVTSYRHLREHGNSFLILIMEAALGLLLYIFSKVPINTHSLSAIKIDGSTSMQSIVVACYMVIITLWILPAATVWLLGERIEKEFIDC